MGRRLRHADRFMVFRGRIQVKTLRTKILIGLLPTLAILVALGLWAIVMFYRLGGNIDVILRENYRSVLAAEGMKEAIERMDSGLLFAVGGRDQRGREQFDAQPAAIRGAAPDRAREYHRCRESSSSPTSWRACSGSYLAAADRFFGLPAAAGGAPGRGLLRRAAADLRPIRERADQVLTLNQDNMTAMDRRARENAAHVDPPDDRGADRRDRPGRRRRLAAEPVDPAADPGGHRRRAGAGAGRARPGRRRPPRATSWASSRSRSTRWPGRSASIRQAGTARLLRAQKTAQATIDSFPDPVVVVDPLGSVEQANPAARRLLGVVPAAEPAVPWYPPQPLKSLVSDVLAGRGDYLPLTLEQAIPLADGGQERYFLPRVVAIRAGRTS